MTGSAGDSVANSLLLTTELKGSRTSLKKPDLLFFTVLFSLNIMVERGLIWNCCLTNGKTLGSVFQQDLNENEAQRKSYV